jgi:hypothetical protein
MTDPPTERLAAYEPIYRALLRILHALGRADCDLRSDAAVVAAADIAVTSGLLWITEEGGDIVAALRNLADHLQQRRDREPAKPLRGTVREVFDCVRPVLAN